MDDIEQLSWLIGEIYDAALDRSLWLAVLEKTCEFVNGQTATLSAQSATQTHFYFQWGLEAKCLELLNRTYAAINPLYVPVMVSGKVGEIYTVADFVPYDEFVASKFYREWAAAQHLGDGMFLLFEKSATTHAGISVIRSSRDGPIDDRSIQRFRLLSPHFRRAVAIGRIIDRHKFEAAALADTLDGLATAMFLVDVEGRLVHANAAGYAMSENGDVIQAIGGKFSAVDKQAYATLRDIYMSAENGDEALTAKSVEVPLSSSAGGRYVAYVLPLTSGARRQAGTTYSAAAAIFVRKTDFELPHPLETIASVFKLTPAEMRVMMMVVQLGSAREVAPVLGISEPTVRTHLQHIFEKTNTSRQAELVKLVAGYMSPLS